MHHRYCEDFANKLGNGYEGIKNSLKNGEVLMLENNGVFIRSSEKPPIGDINKNATDIGIIPDVERLLLPSRVYLSGLGEPGFDPAPWLARFDEMDVFEWSNSKSLEN